MIINKRFYLLLSFIVCIMVEKGNTCFFNDLESSGSIISWFDGDSFDSTTNIWNDKISGNPSAIIGGSGIEKLENLATDNENYLNNKPVIYGSTSTNIEFPVILPPSGTSISICRYQNSGTSGRIMNAQSFNGVCVYNYICKFI